MVQRALCVFVLGCVLGSAVARAADGRQRTATIALRVLSYDQKLKERAGDRIDLVVVCAATEHGAVAAVWQSRSGLSVQGLPVDVRVVDDDAAAAAAAQGADVVFIDGHVDAAVVDALAAAAREHGFLLIVDDKALLARGAHVAIADLGGRSRLIVSLQSVKAAGLTLASELLALAVVVR